jgi:lipopolysaccharide export system permease protein
MDLSKELQKNVAKEQNFLQLVKYLAVKKDIPDDVRQSMKIELYDKIALPVTTIVFVLIGVPLAITPPRVRYNRGFLFSILIIFFYYLIRALSVSFGEAGALPPVIAAWLPNMIITIFGTWLYYKKVFTID